jgi:peptide/nickel transport system ATP-binding protein
MSEPLVVEELEVAFGNRTVVKGVSFSIAEGEAFGLVGESGSGKSTIAFAAVRYLGRGGRISSGRILVDGQDVARLSAANLRQLRRQKVAMVYQDPAAALNPSLRVSRQMTEVFAAEAEAVAMLGRVRIADPERVMRSYPHELSGGMQQRVVIAMALANDPGLLILDEPTTGLDATVEADILDLLSTLRRESGLAMLFISHNLNIVRRLCDRVGVLKDGELVETGSVDQVFDHPKHAYTAALIDAMPRRDQVKTTRAIGEPILSVTDLSKTFTIDGKALRAVGDVSFDLHAGETLGVIGESGSGKSTIARLLLGLLTPDRGTVTLDANPLPPRVGRRSLAQLSTMQMVFQNPGSALNRAHNVRRLIDRALGHLGLSRQERNERVRTLLKSVRLTDETLRQKPSQLSGGMQQRVAIARALAGKPRIVVLDEPTSALDVSVQAAILKLLAELQAETGVSYIFISHDLNVVHAVADRIAVLYLGRIMEIGTTQAIFDGPRHPYTTALLSAADTGETGLKGDPPSPTDVPSACPFQTRCPRKIGPICEEQEPGLVEAGDGHAIRCHIPADELQT